MNAKTFLLLIAVLMLYALWQRAYGQNTLDNYIKVGLDSNLAIKQQTFDLKKAKLDLERARSLFFPQIGLNANYTLATGGRSIDVPLGDLLNNVYSSLNQLTSSTKFPQVQNQSIQFLPNDFQETQVQVSLPIYNPSLSYNRQIKQELINNKQVEINLYKRDLVYNIKQAYYQYLQAVKAMGIYSNALTTVNENLRYNEKLVKHNAATKEVVLKAQAEVSKVQTSLADALQKQKNSAAYFNFLLNRSFDAPILFDSSIIGSLKSEMHISVDVPANREELQQLKSTQKILETNLKLNETYKLPVINGFYNVGFQGFGYKFDNNQFFQLGGLQLQWNIFKGNDNKYKARQSQTDIDAISNQYQNTQQQLLLQVTTTYNTYQSALDALRSANDEMLSTKEAYRLTQSRYQQGQALQIEIIDARTQMTTAEIKYSLAQLTVLNKTAELERVLATYTLP